MNKKLFIVLFLSLIARIAYLFTVKDLWWDAAVYLSMSKYFLSAGHLGLWEPIRPLLWPFLLSYAYLLHIPATLWGEILSTLFSLGCIYLTYKIAEKLFDKKVAFLSSFLLSFTWIFFFFNARLYTEIPAVFFALAAYYYFLKDKPLETGICAALAFLTKFPEGLIIIIFALFWIKSFKKLFFLSVGFIALLIPYLTFNYFAYGSPIATLFFAQEFLKYAGIWIFKQPWYYYPLEIIKQNFLYLFAIPGFYIAWRKRRYELALIILASLLYFSSMAHKEIRFAILFLPFLAILAALGYRQLFKDKIIFIIIILIIGVVHLQFDAGASNSYFTYFEGKNISGEILAANPLTAYYAEKEITMMYYPWFNASQGEYWLMYIKEKQPDYVSLDTCEGGFICPLDENACEEKRLQIISYLDINYTKVFENGWSKCQYFIYKSEASNTLTSS
ncbi:glycosyltransferase family 39 protein [Candidatus Woesearchaeota archaeon]|nr:glycosyltransferase family 39 protein [Candidatus Woesearchaeota archaeon]